MKKIAFFVVIFFFAFFIQESYAQVEVSIDPSFGTGGNTEINIGGFNNEVTAFDAGKTSPTTVCGKIGTANQGVFRLGMIRLDTAGKPDQKFGTAGIVNMTWSVGDYPLDMKCLWDIDSTVVLAGVTGSTKNPTPSIYHFKKNGTPDSTFGVAGIITMPFEANSDGEADNIFEGGFGEYVVCGRSIATDGGGVNGFGVMMLTPAGKLDTAYGSGGRMIIPALVHSVHGFFQNDRFTIMCGISDTGKPEILLARFDYKGSPDTLISKTGLIHTGIILPAGNSIIAKVQALDDKMIILIPAPQVSPTPITLYRFNQDGSLDSTYGNKGKAINIITPSIDPKGLNIASDNSAVVSGMASIGLGQSITCRLNDTTAAPDPKYFPGGIAQLDIDNGAFENYLNYVTPVGKTTQTGTTKRYIGVGQSIHNGISHIMVTRLLTAPVNSVDENSSINNSSISIFPNPAVTSFKITINGSEIKNIRIADALGREVLRLDSERSSDHFSADASSLPNGMYFCIVQEGGKQIIQRFMVTH